MGKQVNTNTMRLDKMLVHLGVGSRSEIKKLVKQTLVTVNDETVKDSGMKIDLEKDIVRVDGEQMHYRAFIYIMLNKPRGVISATEDARERTVLELLPDSLRTFQPFPVGRLDKDTVGLLLLTNDGKLAHELLSPRKHVDKTYYVEASGRLSEADLSKLEQGVTLDDGYVTMPAQAVRVASSGEADQTCFQLTIQEGKFHQVKRMVQAVGSEVTYLKRIRMGPLVLDHTLTEGDWRELTEDEVAQLQSRSTDSPDKTAD
ncbi:pseudouridine synthase [Marinicrinis sediminis]|uniref:Pseudouridine synthase n=1 Tax=Marinicrinis sediminis TaxID=1652465 RepID=A0ABW5R9V5_9BACL